MLMGRVCTKGETEYRKLSQSVPEKVVEEGFRVQEDRMDEGNPSAVTRGKGEGGRRRV